MVLCNGAFVLLGVASAITMETEMDLKADASMAFNVHGVQSLVLSNLARTGEAPPVETATVIGPLSKIDGKIKSHIFGLSTTFTKIDL